MLVLNRRVPISELIGYFGTIPSAQVLKVEMHNSISNKNALICWTSFCLLNVIQLTVTKENKLVGTRRGLLHSRWLLFLIIKS